MKIAVYVEDNLGEPIKLSVSHFARLFKLSTGVTAMSFVEQCRVRRAQTLIHDRDLPLVEVALITGFSDQAISRDAIVYTPAARLPLLRVSMGAGVPHSGSTTRLGGQLAGVTNRYSDGGGPLSSLTEITLNSEGPFSLPDYHEEAFQLGVASQIPAVFRSRQLSDGLIAESSANVGHEGRRELLNRFSNGFGELSCLKVRVRFAAKLCDESL